MTQFAGALRAQLNLQPDTENTQSVPRSATSEFLSKAVSSLDLSGAASQMIALAAAQKRGLIDVLI